MGKTIKKILCTLLVVVMCLTSAPLGGFVGLELDITANAIEASGSCGENVTYTYDSLKRTLIIRGTGAMTDYVGYNSPFYNSNIKSVIIEAGVTTIGDYSFCSSESITSVTIPDGLTTIGNSAFEYCESIESINIPNSVTNIGNNVFLGCYSLTSLLIGENLTAIGSYAFYNCRRLASIILPDSVRTIGNSAFSNTAYFENSANWENDMLYINNYLIETKPSFSGTCAIKNGTIVVADNAFFDCDGLKDITIPDSVLTIGREAFRNCDNLTSITIGDGVINIGDWVFYNCKSLERLTVGESVTTIGDFAFSWCTNLISVIIPNSVKFIGEGAFYACRALKKIDISCGITIISNETFYGCENLTNITIPNSVITIGSSVFAGCHNLESITFGENIETIMQSAFSGCRNLEEVFYPSSKEKWNIVTIEDSNGYLLDAKFYFLHKHDYAITLTKDATCTQNGEKLYTCKYGDTKTEVITRLGHDMVVDTAKSVAATCTKTGLEVKTCSRCAETSQKVISSTGHQNTETIPGTPAECTLTGVKEAIRCKDCGKWIQAQVEIPALGHSWKTTKTVDSTCYEKGYILKECQRTGCKATEVTDIPEAHEFSTFKTIKAPTCTESGIMSKTCSKCKQVIEEKIPELGHTKKIVAEVAATCTKDGKKAGVICTVCGVVISGCESIYATGHKTAVKKGVAPTCTEKGIADGYYCSVCNEVFIEQTELAALGHDFEIETISPTCTEKGEKISSCINCDEVIIEDIEPTGHYWLIDEEISPTCTSEGKSVTWCFDCGEKKEETVIEKIPHNYQAEWQTIIAPTCTATGVSIKICRGCFDIQTSILQVVNHIDVNGDYKCDMCSLDMTPSQPAEPDTPEVHVCKDENADGICDTCGYDFTQDCDCRCHKSGIAKFFFNIGLFFQKLFKKNAVCACGVAHY